MLTSSFYQLARPNMLASMFGISLPPPVALVMTLGFILFLFRRDFRERPNVSRALWLPILWIILSVSRPVSEWLKMMGIPVIGATSLEEGSPLDACVYFGLISAGMYVLGKRGVNLGRFMEQNALLTIFLLYCFVAISWSDFPFVALKRWIKIVGLPVMALVVFSEPNFQEAVTRLMKRCAYVLLPLSILLIKYYPEIGRKFDEWTGLATNNGVAQTKNMLGCGCMLLGLFLSWHLLQVRKQERSRARRTEIILTGCLLLMIAWLFKMSHSATSSACLLIGVSIMLILGRRAVDKRYVGIYMIVGVLAIVVAQGVFGISSYVIELLHRDPTLTDRTILWSDLLKVKINPIFGVGFESFWLGPRLALLHVGRAWQPNEAHNGYLETYLSLGLIGLVMLLGILTVTLYKIRWELLTDFEWARFELAFVIALVLYNCTEVSFRGPHALWLVFYIVAINYPRRTEESAAVEIGSELEESPTFAAFG